MMREESTEKQQENSKHKNKLNLTEIEVIKITGEKKDLEEKWNKCLTL